MHFKKNKGQTNPITLEAKVIDNFFAQLIVVLSLYLFFLTGFFSIRDRFSFLMQTAFLPMVGAILLLIPVIYLIIHLVKSPNFRWEYLGFTWKRWLPVTLESIFYTLLIIVLITGLKWLDLHEVLYQHPPPLFNYFILNWSQYTLTVMLFIGIYITVALCQEIAIRSVMQTVLSLRFSTGCAIILSNLIFAVLHLILSFSYGVAIFILGTFWGWLFARQRSLIGVFLSHSLIGVWVLYVLGDVGWLI